MTARLNLTQFDAAVRDQNAMVFQNAAHTQYGVAIPCPECGKTTQWVEGQNRGMDSNVYRMQPCGHEVPSDARQIGVDDNGYLRVQNPVPDEGELPDAAGPSAADDLAQWIGAQLDEDERIAKEAAAGFGAAWTVDSEMESVRSDKGADVIEEPHTPTVFIAEHDPARVLREIDAKRRLLDRHAPHSMGSCRTCEAPHWGVQVCNHCERRWPCPDILDLASVYADRTGYRGE